MDFSEIDLRKVAVFLLIIIFLVIVVLSFFSSNENTEPQTQPTTAENQSAPPVKPVEPAETTEQTPVVPAVSAPSEQDLKMYRIIETDTDYNDLIGLVGDLSKFRVSSEIPLGPEQVSSGSTYLADKLPDYEQYLPHLQQLELNDNTLLAGLQVPGEVNGTTIYSVYDPNTEQSLQLFLFLKLQINPKISL